MRSPLDRWITRFAKQIEGQMADDKRCTLKGGVTFSAPLCCYTEAKFWTMNFKNYKGLEFCYNGKRGKVCLSVCFFKVERNQTILQTNHQAYKTYTLYMNKWAIKKPQRVQ